MKYGSYSKKGFRNSRARLHSVEYIKYTKGNLAVYMKKKAYVSAYDGYYAYEKITERTYKNAKKRGYELKEISIEDNITNIPVDVLIMFFKDKFDISKQQLRKSLYNSRKATEDLDRQLKLCNSTKYKVFMATLNFYTDFIYKENIQSA